MHHGIYKVANSAQISQPNKSEKKHDNVKGSNAHHNETTYTIFSMIKCYTKLWPCAKCVKKRRGDVSFMKT